MFNVSQPNQTKLFNIFFFVSNASTETQPFVFVICGPFTNFVLCMKFHIYSHLIVSWHLTHLSLWLATGHSLEQGTICITYNITKHYTKLLSQSQVSQLVTAFTVYGGIEPKFPAKTLQTHTNAERDEIVPAKHILGA